MNYEIAFWLALAVCIFSPIPVGFRKWNPQKRDAEKVEVVIVLDSNGKYLAVKTLDKYRDKLDVRIITQSEVKNEQ